jgi:hypothetical protein
MSKIVISWDVLNLMYDFEKAVASLATPMDDVIAKRTALRTYISELEAEIIKCHELQDFYCDRIAELEAELKNARELIGMTPAFPAWIPVSERLPEKDGYYMVYDCRYEQHFDALFRGGAWSPYIYNLMVTHWMPLPEPPEVRNG